MLATSKPALLVRRQCFSDSGARA